MIAAVLLFAGLTAVLLFAGLTAVLAWRVLPHPATLVLGQGADTALNVWILAWDTHVLLGAAILLDAGLTPQPAYALHWKPLVNGFSGATPGRQRQLQRAVHCFTTPDGQAAPQTLRRQGLGYVLLDRARSPVLAGRWDRWEPPGWLVEEGRWGETLLLRVDEGAPRAATPLPVERVARFADGIALESWRFDPDSGRLSLSWLSTAWPDHEYTVFAHLVGPDGQRLGQSDAWPGAGLYPTSEWCPGDRWEDAHQLSAHPLRGSRIHLGLYRLKTLERLPIEAAELPVADRALVLPLE